MRLYQLEKLKEKLWKLAARECWIDDINDFDICCNCGGNYDDAYYGGSADGEALLAREVLAVLEPNKRQYVYTLKVLLDHGRAPRGVKVSGPDDDGVISHVDDTGAYLVGHDKPYDPATLYVCDDHNWMTYGS